MKLEFSESEQEPDQVPVHSEEHDSHLNHVLPDVLPVPSLFKNPFNVIEGPASSAAGNSDKIAKMFPCLFGQPSAVFVLGEGKALESDKSLKIGVLLSGGQAPGEHNVISGIYDYLQDHCKGSTLYGLKGGPAGIMNCEYITLTSENIYCYTCQDGSHMILSGRENTETCKQFKQVEGTASMLDLDGLVLIGGNESNTNGCVLAENFRSDNLKTQVIGCPMSIENDLKCEAVPTSFGFDTACKIYAELIRNVMTDARSTRNCYHFVRLMGRAASHITLECALQTHPNITLIGEEVAWKKETLKNITDHIADVVCKRGELGYNYGVILVPEGFIDFIPEVQHLIAELNGIFSNHIVDEGCDLKKKLAPQSLKLFELLPSPVQDQLIREKDPLGKVQVDNIEIEKMLIQIVETELKQRKKAGLYKGQFRGQSHFFSYEGQHGLSSKFDASYGYVLGYGAGALLHSGKTGLISSVGNLTAPVTEWTVGGTPSTSLMDVEKRYGKFVPVIKKAIVELDGAPFKRYVSLREKWTLTNCYTSCPIQVFGDTFDTINQTLLLELGVELPVEMINEIMLKGLSGKFVGRARLVSKSWYKLLTGPWFLKEYAKSSKDSLIIGEEWGGNFLLTKLDLSSDVLVNDAAILEGVKIKVGKDEILDFIWGSVDGIVLLSLFEGKFYSLYLGNLLLGNFKRLPNWPECRKNDCYSVFGVGEVSDEIYVMGIYIEYNSKSQRYFTRVRVCHNSKRWTSVPSFPNGTPPPQQAGVFIDGVVYWAGYKKSLLDGDIPYLDSSPSGFLVTAFNLQRQNYELVAQPSYKDGTYKLSLGKLCVRLCICASYKDRIELWLNNGSWELTYIIPDDVGQPRFWVEPLWVDKDIVLLDVESDLAIHLRKENMLRLLRIITRGHGVCLTRETLRDPSKKFKEVERRD